MPAPRPLVYLYALCDMWDCSLPFSALAWLHPCSVLGHLSSGVASWGCYPVSERLWGTAVLAPPGSALLRDCAVCFQSLDFSSGTWRGCVKTTRRCETEVDLPTGEDTGRDGPRASVCLLILQAVPRAQTSVLS